MLISSINLTAPENGFESQSQNATITFEYIPIGNITRCYLYVNDVSQQNDTNITSNATHSFSQSFSNGDYDWFVRCIDPIDNTKDSGTRTFTVNYQTEEGGSRGGGGGGGGGYLPPVNNTLCIESWSCSPWYNCIEGVQARSCVDVNNCGTTETKPVDTQSCVAGEQEQEQQSASEDKPIVLLSQEYNINLELKETYVFYYMEEEHRIVLEQVLGEDSVNLTLYSEPQTFILTISESKEFDLDNDGMNDIKISLEGTEEGRKADINIIFLNRIDRITGQAVKGKPIEVIPQKGPDPYYMIPAIMLIIIFITVLSLRKTELSDRAKKLLTTLHISLVFLIVVLFLASFITKASISGFTIANKTIISPLSSSAVVSVFNAVKIPLFIVIGAAMLASLVFVYLHNKKKSGYFSKSLFSRKFDFNFLNKEKKQESTPKPDFKPAIKPEQKPQEKPKLPEPKPAEPKIQEKPKPETILQKPATSPKLPEASKKTDVWKLITEKQRTGIRELKPAEQKEKPKSIFKSIAGIFKPKHEEIKPSEWKPVVINPKDAKPAVNQEIKQTEAKPIIKPSVPIKSLEQKPAELKPREPEKGLEHKLRFFEQSPVLKPAIQEKKLPEAKLNNQYSVFNPKPSEIKPVSRLFIKPLEQKPFDSAPKQITPLKFKPEYKPKPAEIKTVFKQLPGYVQKPEPTIQKPAEIKTVFRQLPGFVQKPEPTIQKPAEIKTVFKQLPRLEQKQEAVIQKPAEIKTVFKQLPRPEQRPEISFQKKEPETEIKELHGTQILEPNGNQSESKINKENMLDQLKMVYKLD
jgi:hypothetical protein